MRVLVPVSPGGTPPRTTFCALPTATIAAIAAHLMPDAASLLALRLTCRRIERAILADAGLHRSLRDEVLRRELGLNAGTFAIAKLLVETKREDEGEEEEEEEEKYWRRQGEDLRSHQLRENRRRIEFLLRLFFDSYVTRDPTWAEHVTQTEIERLRIAMYRLHLFSLLFSQQQVDQRITTMRQQEWIHGAGGMSELFPLAEAAPMICVAEWFQYSFGSWLGEPPLEECHNFRTEVCAFIRRQYLEQQGIPTTRSESPRETIVSPVLEEFITKAGRVGARDTFCKAWKTLMDSLAHAKNRSDDDDYKSNDE